MASWVHVSEDSIRGKNQKDESLWTRVLKLYHESQAENPNEIHVRNMESLKCRWKRLNENANKLVAACREANMRKRRGMSNQDIEKEAHTIYRAGGSKFQDLIVFNEVMSKHPKWSIAETTHVINDNEVGGQQSGSNSKRTRTSECGEFTIPSNPKTPLSNNSTTSGSMGRDKAKRKGKGKAKQSDSAENFTEELRVLRLTKETEIELEKTWMEFERKKMERNSIKMKEKMLIKLLDKDHLTPAQEEMARKLTEIVFGKQM